MAKKEEKEYREEDEMNDIEETEEERVNPFGFDSQTNMIDKVMFFDGGWWIGLEGFNTWQAGAIQAMDELKSLTWIGTKNDGYWVLSDYSDNVVPMEHDYYKFKLV